MSHNLLIVESAAKVKTIEKILGAGFRVVSCMGHVRDLPKSKLGVDVAHGFQPTYVSTAAQEKVVAAIRREAREADVVYLATDPDREGEAIAYHLSQLLNGARMRRVSFNEITKDAVLAAIEAPREIDERLVASQQARRILDRLVGYSISPLLWKKVTTGLSAGRVQSVAVRLICEREEAIQDFVPVEYWGITATFRVAGGDEFDATLVSIAGESLMGAGRLEKYDRRLASEADAQRECAAASRATYNVTSFTRKEKRRSPPPPFTTSTLQQAAARGLNFTGKRTMVVAQTLYEGVDLGDGERVGLITYMRTDSVRVTPSAVAAARDAIATAYGPAYVPAEPRFYRSRRQSQDAHEAIRPTEAARAPRAIKKYLTPDQFRLYDLIYRRFLASQMADAVFEAASTTITGGDYVFRATAQRLKFPGFLAATPGEDKEDSLPTMSEGEPVALVAAREAQHFTQPPPRYNDASLVQALEEYGIGRPSTYAPIVATIIARKYVERRERKFYPTELGKLVNALLVSAFPDIFDVGFTARIEEELDEVEEGRTEWVNVLNEFYDPFRVDLEKAGEVMDAVRDDAVEKTSVLCPRCGTAMEVRWGRFGKYLRCGRYPDCKETANFTRDADGEIVVVRPEVTGETCEKCGGAMVVKKGRFGEFLACENYPECKNTKPILKKVDAVCPKCGAEVVQRKGRRGVPFYGCSRYPECDFTANALPVNQSCPTCGGSYLLKRGKRLYCPIKECGYKAEA